MTTKGMRFVKRTFINGKAHRPCVKCGKLFIEDYDTNCKPCRSIIRKENRRLRNLKIYGTDHSPKIKKRRDIQRKYINGIRYVLCTDCSEWVKEEIDSTNGRCKPCHRIYFNKFYRSHYGKNKDEFTEKREAEKKKIADRLIEKELNGALPIRGLFVSVRPELKNALESGDFNAFMSAEYTPREYQLPKQKT